MRASVLLLLLLAGFSANAAIFKHGSAAAGYGPQPNSVAAAIATANNNPVCSLPYVGFTWNGVTGGGVGVFYWEVGNRSGFQAGGSVGTRTGSSNYPNFPTGIQANTVMQFDSFSKILSSAAIVQYLGGYANVTGVHANALHQIDGYANLAENSRASSCPNSINAGNCLNWQINVLTKFGVTFANSSATISNLGNNNLQTGQIISFNGSPSPFSDNSDYQVLATPTATTFTVCLLDKVAQNCPGGAVVSGASTNAFAQYTPCTGAYAGPVSGCGANPSNKNYDFVSGRLSAAGGLLVTNIGNNYLQSGMAVAMQTSNPPDGYVQYSNLVPTSNQIYYVSSTNLASNSFQLCTAPGCAGGLAAFSGATLEFSAGNLYGATVGGCVGVFCYDGGHWQNEVANNLGTCAIPGGAVESCYSMTPTDLAAWENGFLYGYPNIYPPGAALSYFQSLPAGGASGNALSIRAFLQNVLSGANCPGACPNGGLFYYSALDANNTVCTLPGGDYSAQTINGSAGPSFCPAYGSPLSLAYQYSTGIWVETSYQPASANPADGAFAGIGSSGVVGRIDSTKTYYGIVMANNGGGAGGVTDRCAMLISRAYATGNQQFGLFPSASGL